MRLTDLLHQAGLDPPPLSSDPPIAGLTADSRNTGPGWLFAALPGQRADGAEFISEALARGCAVILSGNGTPVPPGPHVTIRTDNPRLALARLAAAFYAPAPATLVAVTGTNGKTSVVNFTAMIWQELGLAGASIGTLGVRGAGCDRPGTLTSPDPVTLSRVLHDLGKAGATHAALEASSHGLHQYRLDGLVLAAAGFTYLGRDHLDYHGNMESYFAAKALLFERVLPAGAAAVLNADIPEFPFLHSLCEKRGLRIFSYGRYGRDLRLLAARARPGGLDLEMEICGQRLTAPTALTGGFQAGNLLCALGLVIATGADPARAAETCRRLTGVPGRLELVGQLSGGAAVYVDYAHTPDALETVLTALRAHTPGRLVLVFGCGGNRDPGKRPAMGAIAARLADHVIVTDDNPRHEEPASIRAAILNACPGGQEVADRTQAIQAALSTLKPGDTLLIAGKGHEQGQIVGDVIIPFDDAEVVRRALKGPGES